MNFAKRADGARQKLMIRVWGIWFVMVVVFIGFMAAQYFAAREGSKIAKAVETQRELEQEKDPILLTLRLTQSALFLNGKSIGLWSEIENANMSTIAPLEDALNEQHVPNAKIMIHADKSVTFRIIKKVMMTCSMTHHEDISFATSP
jgi:biopolymer transport protein ExbD